MTLALTVILFLIGILLIVKGGDLFVDAAAWLAEVSGIPKLIVGATLVSVATTLPEMLVSMIAAGKGQVDMSIGNAVGSVTANVGLIMAISILAIPAVIRRKDYLAKAVMMLIASVLIVVCGFGRKVSVPVCLVLLAIFAVFMYENIHTALRSRKGEEALPRSELPASAELPKKRELPGKQVIFFNVFKFVIGALGIVVGAQLLVDKGEILALAMGVDERIIGITIIAVGTSVS